MDKVNTSSNHASIVEFLAACDMIVLKGLPYLLKGLS
jgi:hypothetical protein